MQIEGVCISKALWESGRGSSWCPAAGERVKILYPGHSSRQHLVGQCGEVVRGKGFGTVVIKLDDGSLMNIELKYLGKVSDSV